VVNRDVWVCKGGVDGATTVAGYNVLESVEFVNVTAYAGDGGQIKLWAEMVESSSPVSSPRSDSPLCSSASSAAQLNPRPIEVTPQLFPTLTARLKASLAGGAPQLSSSKVISTAAVAVSIEKLRNVGN
jgi:hypothetical protein